MKNTVVKKRRNSIKMTLREDIRVEHVMDYMGKALIRRF